MFPRFTLVKGKLIEDANIYYVNKQTTKFLYVNIYMHNLRNNCLQNTVRLSSFMWNT